MAGPCLPKPNSEGFELEILISRSVSAQKSITWMCISLTLSALLSVYLFVRLFLLEGQVQVLMENVGRQAANAEFEKYQRENPFPTP